MQEYYFLYAFAFAWMVFATVQDLKTTEIANWVSFSLVAFVLAYRGFYAIWSKDVMFFVYGLLGVIVFTVLAYGFYYMKVFGGGDAKLLIGLGGIWPYAVISDYLVIGIGFVFLLFAVGAIYTIFYSLFLVNKNQKKFVSAFGVEFGKSKLWLSLAVLVSVVFEVAIWLTIGVGYFSVLALIFILLPLLYIYTKAVEVSCMVVLKRPKELIEGDWLIDEVKVGRKMIRKSVHGLSEEDIRLLKKANKKVWIKNGVPFTPAFLIAFVIMIFVLRYSSGLFNYLS